MGPNMLYFPVLDYTNWLHAGTWKVNFMTFYGSLFSIAHCCLVLMVFQLCILHEVTWKNNQYFGSNYQVHIEVFVPFKRICSIEKGISIPMVQSVWRLVTHSVGLPCRNCIFENSRKNILPRFCKSRNSFFCP